MDMCDSKCDILERTKHHLVILWLRVYHLNLVMRKPDKPKMRDNFFLKMCMFVRRSCIPQKCQCREKKKIEEKERG